MKHMRLYQIWIAALKGYTVVYCLLMGLAIVLILLALPAFILGEGQTVSAAEAGDLLWVVRLPVFLAGAVIVGRAVIGQTVWPRRQRVRREPAASLETQPAIPRPTRLERPVVAESWSAAAR